MGHGWYSIRYFGKAFDGIIAGLPLEEYQQLLEYFNTINVDLLYIASCFSGGQNLLDAFRKDTENVITSIIPHYFIIVGTTTDAVSRGVKWRFKDFFTKTSEFLDFGKIKDCKDKNRTTGADLAFKCIISALTAEDKAITNIASVRFPGSINYFSAINADNNLVIINYTTATSRSLETNPDKRKFIVDKDPITKQDKAAVLLYPIDIKVPIEIKQEAIPAIISMIPGNAFHIIPELKFNEDLNELITEGFFPFDIVRQKIFLIKKLKIENFYIPSLSRGPIELHNVMINKKGPKLEANINIEFEYDNTFYKGSMKYNTDRKAYDLLRDVQKISPKDSKIKSAIEDIKVLQEGLSGQEDVKKLKQQAIAEFVVEPEVEKGIPFVQPK